jgi:hypothetical protein
MKLKTYFDIQIRENNNYLSVSDKKMKDCYEWLKENNLLFCNDLYEKTISSEKQIKSWSQMVQVLKEFSTQYPTLRVEVTGYKKTTASCTNENNWEGVMAQETQEEKDIYLLEFCNGNITYQLLGESSVVEIDQAIEICRKELEEYQGMIFYHNHDKESRKVFQRFRNGAKCLLRELKERKLLVEELKESIALIA